MLNPHASLASIQDMINSCADSAVRNRLNQHVNYIMQELYGIISTTTGIISSQEEEIREIRNKHHDWPTVELTEIKD